MSIDAEEPRADPTLSGRRRVWIVMFVAIGVHAVFRYFVLEAEVSFWADDIAWTIFSGAAAWRCILSGARTSDRRHRKGWHLLGLGAGMWFLGMLYLVWGHIAVPAFDPYPTPANWLFLALAPCFAAGLFWLRATQPERRLDGKRLADLGLIFSTTAAVWTVTLLEPMRRTGTSPEALLFSVLDPVAFTTVTLFALTVYWLGDLDELESATTLLLGSILVQVAAGFVYFRGVLIAEPVTIPLEPAWLVAFGLQFLAADAYDRRKSSGPDGTSDRVPRRPRRGFVESALPAPLLGTMALVAFAFRDQLSGATVAAASPSLVLFAISLGFREWWVDRSEEETFRKLEASVALTGQILAASPAAVFTYDPSRDTRPTFFSGNVRNIFDVGADETWDWDTRLHPDDLGRFREGVDESLTVDQSRSLECRLMDGSGTYRWVNIRLARYRPGDAQRPRLIGSLVDVDDAKRLEAGVLRGQRMEALGRLSGGVAHDFNNLLTTMLGYAELGLLDPDVSPSSREHFEAVVVAARRAGGLTRQLLAFSRHQSMSMEVIDLAETVGDMTKMLARTLGDDVEISMSTSTARTAVHADPAQIEQVVLNLVVNARDAMPDGGRLEIRIDEVHADGRGGNGATLKAGRYLCLAVTDTGSGMTPDVLERIFEPFFTTKPKGSGTGLGLATLHGVVKQHGGNVEVSSRPGEGSTFRVYLPSTNEVVPKDDSVRPKSIGVGNETILVVDNEASIPRLVRDALTPAGYEVLTAHNASDAIALAEDRARQIDLLLTDVVMPGMQGRELAARLQQLRPELRVVFMSGYADDSDLLRDITGRTVPFIPKPLAIGRLATVLRQILDDPSGGPDPASA